MAKSAEIRSLTGLRGVAALFVVIYHFVSLGQLPGAPLLTHGYMAVDLFFVLSGFVMAATYGNTFVRGFSLADYADFLLLRLGRVYPLYLVMSLLAIPILFYAHSWYGASYARTIITNVLLVQAWGFDSSLDGVAWSISTEFAAYILFPLFALLILHRSWRLALVAAALACVGVAVLAALPTSLLNQSLGEAQLRNGTLDIFGPGTPFPLLRCLFEFPLGVLAWRAAAVPWLRAALGRAAAQWALAAAIIVLLCLHGTDVALVVLFTGFIISLSLAEAAPSRVLGRGACYWLGMVSYSLYLVHFPLRQLSMPLVDRLNGHVPYAFSVVGVLMLGPTILLSFVTFSAIEKPARLWSRRMFKRRSLIAGAPPPVPDGAAAAEAPSSVAV